jgi:uncharacterized protein YjbI with pentapeptide repeats
VSFRKATLENCRFRYASISWSDFRYARISNATFEDATVDFCDFYRAFFEGVVLFKHSSFSNCSIFNAYFGDGSNIRRENLFRGRILQQDKAAYTKFLVDWHNYGTGVRTNDRSQVSDWDPSEAVRSRWADAEDIYKRYLTWVWTTYQAQLREIPGAKPRAAKHRNYVVEQETNWLFLKDKTILSRR